MWDGGSGGRRRAKAKCIVLLQNVEGHYVVRHSSPSVTEIGLRPESVRLEAAHRSCCGGCDVQKLEATMRLIRADGALLGC